MKRILVCILAAIIALGGTVKIKAQGTDTATDKMSTDIRRAIVHNGMRSSGRNGAMSNPALMTEKICAFIRFKSGDADSLLTWFGCEKVTQIGDIYIANIPVAQLEALASVDEVERIETQTSGRLTNNITPQWVNTADIYSGTGLPQAFDGSGVLLGLIDGGFDVTHPTFYNKDGTTYRIKAFVDDYYNEKTSRGVLTPIGREATNMEDILYNRQYSGDTLDTHGTHTLGTAAGSGYETPFRGVAYGADIFAISSRVANEQWIINSADQAARMKRIFDYADEMGQPCVISYSISFDDIPADAQLFGQALQTMLGPGRILVSSAGNKGYYNTYINKPIGIKTAGAGLNMPDKSTRTFYLISQQPFLIRCYSTSYESVSDGDVFTPTDSLTIETTNLPTDSIEFREHHIHIQQADSLYTFSDRRTKIGSGDCGILAFIIEGEDAHVQAYTDSEGYFFLLDSCNIGDSRFGNVESSHNILLPGSLPQVISVGAFVGCDWYIDAYGDTLGRDYGPRGGIAPFSSKGPTLSGILKPDVVAPGVNIISAGSSYYASGYGSSYDLVMVTDFNGRDYPWIAASGTSMAVPCVAGIVALWLQADPTLTPERVKQIISETSLHTDTTMTYPNNTYGYGLIDAYAGMLKVLGIPAAIPGISTHQPSALVIEPTAQGVRLLFETVPTQPFNVSVYTVQGQLLSTQHIEPAHQLKAYEIPLSTDHKGLYVVQVTSTEQGITGSELISY